MKEKILEYIEKSKIRYTTYIKKDVLLLEWINEQILKDYDLKIKIYLILHDQIEIPKCKCGNILKFISVIDGFTNYCSSTCVEKHNDRIMAAKEYYSFDDNKNKAKLKLKQTMILKYSVEHNSQIEYVKAKKIDSWIKKYGVDNPAKNKLVQLTKQNTNLKKYGVPEVFKSQTVQDKIKETNLERYDNSVIFNSKIIQEKIFKTNIEKYGVDKPFKSEFIQNKVKKTNLTKLSVEYPFQSPEFLQKIRDTYHLDNFCYLNQNHINNYEDWIDPNKFKNIVLNNGCFGSSKYFNVHPTTIYKKIGQYDLDIITRFKSLFETSICSFLESYNISFETNTRKIISPKELDIFLPDYNIAIEANGVYWHSDIINKDYKYHFNKTMACKNKDIQLFHIWDIEWNNETKAKIWKNKLLHSLHIITKQSIGARKFIIKQIGGEYNSFITKYHIQGNTPTKYKFGAFYNNVLCAVMGFNLRNNVYDLVRWCVNGNYPGLFSKMLSYSQNYLNITKIITFADLRYSYGDVYIKNGFTTDTMLLPSYFYTNGHKIWHKSNFMKNKIKEKFNIEIENKTEKELMDELGFFRVYDAGKIRFSKSYPA